MPQTNCPNTKANNTHFARSTEACSFLPKKKKKTTHKLIPDIL